MSSLRQLINWRNPRLTLQKLWLRYRLATRHIKAKHWEMVYACIAVGVPLTSACAYLYINTIGLKYYKKYVRLYVNGEEVPITQKVEELALEVWNKAKVPRKLKLLDMVDFFSVSGCDTFGAGSFETHSGAIVGLPYNWAYDNVNEIGPNEIGFVGENNKPIDWQSEFGSQLLDSLVLSTNAQKFGIAREIHLANTFRVHITCVALVFGLMFGVFLGQWAVVKYRLPRSLVLRLVVRAVVFPFGVFLAKIANDSLEYERQVYADDSAVNEGPEFLDGALEFYEKMRARNASLHHLLGEIGKQKYTADGELRRTFGLPTISVTISKRLEKIEKDAKEKIAKELKDKK